MGIEEQLKVEYEQDVGAPFIDSLTGLYNHGFFQIVLEREIKRSERQSGPFTVALIDIAKFNRFNLKTGYRAGDHLLRELAGVIQGHIRETDLAARFQGGLFSVLLMDSGAEEAGMAAARIQDKVRERYGDEVKLYFGMASYPGNTNNREELLAQALEALQQAKVRSQDGIVFFATARQAVDPEESVILLVDDEPVNLKLLEAILKTLPYKILKAANGREALDLVVKEEIDLILLDVMMPEMDGFEVCRRLKSRETTRLIPIVLVTALDDLQSRVTGIDSGADDFVSKPVNRVEIMARVKNLVKTRKQNNRLASIENVLFSLANAVEAKDHYTQGHTQRVANLAITLGEKMGLAPKEIEALRIGGMLHDIGKIGIPVAILNKPGPLTDEEWAMMKTHSDLGHKICSPLEKNLGLALDVIRYHHEKMDRSGYPDRLAGSQIPRVARIMAVVDIYDAMTTDRPYRQALPKETALKYLQEEADQGKLDREVMEHFVRLLR